MKLGKPYNALLWIGTLRAVKWGIKEDKGKSIMYAMHAYIATDMPKGMHSPAHLIVKHVAFIDTELCWSEDIF